MTSRTEQIRAHDGGKLTGYLARPESGYGPGLVVIQEIFGVNDYIKGVCERLAKLGYVALAPDLYWRLEPGIAIDEKEPGGLQKAFGYVGRLDLAKAADRQHPVTADAIAALEHLRGLPEVAGGRAGIIGFCLGGGVSYMVAALSDPVTCVSYYGSAVPNALQLAGQVKCPILFHFGAADDYIPAEKQQAVREAFAQNPRAEFHVHEGAGHAFDNHNAAIFHHERAAHEAWEQTVDFLKRTLPVESD
jgi:carboxymethylenebutenolidase